MPRFSSLGTGLQRFSPELVVAAGFAAIFLAWALADGGFSEADTGGPGLLLLGLLAITAIAFRRDLPSLPAASHRGIGLLGILAAWTYASILWSDAPGFAWEAGNKAALYAATFALFTIPRWSARNAAIAAGGFAMLVAAIGIGVLIHIGSSADPSLYFVDGRLAEPIGYQNGVAALFALAFWPALFLATRPELTPPLRGLMLGCAGLLFSLSLMPQSRGWLVVFPIALLAYVVLVPGRMRLLLMSVPLALAVALTAGSVLNVFEQRFENIGSAFDTAASELLVAAVALTAVGTLLALIEPRIGVRERNVPAGVRRTGWAVAAIATFTIVAGLTASAASGGWVHDRWQDFKGGYSGEAEASRFDTGLGSNRYDFWRVSLDSFSSAPVTGVGGGNFAAEYVRERRSSEEPRDPHGLPFSTLSETGVVGGALLAGALLAIAAGFARSRRHAQEPLSRALSSALAVAFLYWLWHASGDWLWQLPALTAAAFALAGIGTSLAPREATRRADRSHTPVLVVGGLLIAVLAVSITLPWLSAREVDSASRSWAQDPIGAYEDLDRARELNPLSAIPDVTAGTIADRSGEPARATAAFEQALARDSSNWYVELELAALIGERGRIGAARQHARRAARLNPSDPLIREVRLALRSGHVGAIPSIQDAMVERLCMRVGKTTATRYCD